MTLPIPYKLDSGYVSDMTYRKEIYVEFVLKINVSFHKVLRKEVMSFCLISIINSVWFKTKLKAGRIFELI